VVAHVGSGMTYFLCCMRCGLVCPLIGGPGQLPHLAPTYAAVCALCIIGTEQAYESIDRFTRCTCFRFEKFVI